MEKPVPCTKAMVQLESVWGCNKGRERERKKKNSSWQPRPRSSSQSVMAPFLDRVRLVWYHRFTLRWTPKIRERKGWRERRTGHGDREGLLACFRPIRRISYNFLFVCARLFCFVAKIDRLWKLLRGCTPFFSRESSLLASSVRNIHTDVGGLSPPW